jgi:hypothetical protein
VDIRLTHSALMSACRISFAQLSVYSTMNLPNSAGELANGTPQIGDARDEFWISKGRINFFVERRSMPVVGQPTRPQAFASR